MLEITPLVIMIALGVGFLCGMVYFGGLWWTVRSMPQAHHPMRFYFGSLILRLTMIAAVFVGLLRYGDWQWLAVALVGFITARLLLIRWSRVTSPTQVAPRRAV